MGGHSTVQAFGGSVETASALVDSVNVGDLTMGETQAVVISGGPFTPGGLVGILDWGADLRSRCQHSDRLWK